MFTTLTFVIRTGITSAILLLPLGLSSADDNSPPVISMTAEDFVTALKEIGRAASNTRFAGKQIELTGKLQMFDVSESGGSYVFLGGAKFWAVHDEPWALALPGQTIKVRGIYRGPGGFDVSIVKASGERLVLTATELAEQFERDAQTTNKKYDERWMELRGIVSNKPKDSIGRSVIVLKGAGKTDVFCFVQRSFVESAKTGDVVQIVGRYSKNESPPALFEGKGITDVKP